MFQISVLSKTVMVFLVILIEISTVHAQSKDAKDGADGKYVDYTLQHDGLKREYTIRTPTKFKPTEKLPVMFVLHGGGKDDGRATAKRFNFENLADINRFIVVYPSGIQAQWNDGRGRTFRRGRNSDVDDVSYLSTLIDLVISRWHADASRIYFTGASNGGMMTHRIGIELTHKVAAIAPIIANIPERLSTLKPEKRLPVLIINSTGDPLVPFQGGHVTVLGRKLGKVTSTNDSIKFWIQNNFLSSNPKLTQLENKDPDDGCRVSVTKYGSDSNFPVVLYKVIGGGHTIPGMSGKTKKAIVGRTCMDFKATEAVWDFCKNYRRTTTPEKK